MFKSSISGFIQRNYCVIFFFFFCREVKDPDRKGQVQANRKK